MRLAKKFANLAVVAFALSLAPSVGAQGQPMQQPAPKKMAKSRKAGSKGAPKAPAAAAAKPAASDAAPMAAPEAAPSSDKPEAIANKRDPFLPLVAVQQQAASGEHLPPGKAGLVIASVRVDGTVKAPNGMLAVVSNPEQRVYFVREGDHLYDGDVEKIGLDGVTFRENSKDAFGKSVERLVTKRIYPSAGEQQ
jgi:Tfp pilus assembly protein PilP